MSKTPIDLVNWFVDELYKIYDPTSSEELKSNLYHHEYYFRTKFYEKKYSKKSLQKVLDKFKFTLADAGDAVGMKAALAIGEALTQAPLKAIHAGGGGISQDALLRSKSRFQELLAGHPDKHCVITLKLIDDSKEASEKFANEQETFYFKEVWKSIQINLCGTLDKMIYEIHPKIDFDNIKPNGYYLKCVCSLVEISDYNIHIVDVISRLVTNFQEILFMTGTVLNSKEFMMYIIFKSNISFAQIQKIIHLFGAEDPQCIIHGKYLKNCYVSENKNMPGHFLVQANEVAGKDIRSLENMIYDKRLDAPLCRITDMKRSLNLFGLNETLARMHEELLYASVNQSETQEILFRHYKTICDGMMVNGSFKYASRNSIKNDPYTDTFKLINFETAPDMIRNALHKSTKNPIIDPVAASVFGELPGFGTGVSKITLFKSGKKCFDKDEKEEKEK
jgi:hypothetical protein